MTFEPVPRIGSWYKNTIGDAFEVIAQDEEDDTLELQYYDGTVEELDPEAWGSMNPESIEPPEDWTGPVDDVERDDLGYSETDMEPDDWTGDADEYPRRRERWQRKDEEQEHNEWGETGPEEEPSQQ